jgi:hypothetical protein
MSNGDAERLPEDGAAGAPESPTLVPKARAVKATATKKRTAKTVVAKAPATNAVAKRTTARRPNRKTSGHIRVQLGKSEMFVSREVAGALSNKDLKRLRAVFKRTLKRARKRDRKKKR